jgi:Zn-dependent peptidase ImmA (M78 family)
LSYAGVDYVPQVNPEILKWARETAGLTPEEAVQKLSIGPARGVAAVDRLLALEAGEEHPSRPLLVRMAKQYRRPLLSFYLLAPPRRGDRGSDFRKLRADASATDEARLDALIRSIRARQSIIRSALEEEGDVEQVGFVGSMTVDVGVQAVVEDIREVIDVDLLTIRALPTAADAFRLIRSATEKAGVFVLLIGDLGSHHTAFDLETFRGFALSDAVAPFIVVNDRDSQAAWSFTVVHELAHLWLGQTGVSGVDSDQDTENFCNNVAGEFFLPSEELKSTERSYWSGTTNLISRISEYARERNLSNTLVAYRLLQIGAINAGDYKNVRDFFRDRWLESRQHRRILARSQRGGPSYFVVRAHRVGDALLQTTTRLMRGQILTTSKAGKVLGVKAKQVGELMQARGFSSKNSIL